MAMTAEEEIGGYAWTTSCTVNDKSEENWLMLAKALMESSTIEEYKIRRDLLAADACIKENCYE